MKLTLWLLGTFAILPTLAASVPPEAGDAPVVEFDKKDGIVDATSNEEVMTGLEDPTFKELDEDAAVKELEEETAFEDEEKKSFEDKEESSFEEDEDTEPEKQIVWANLEHDAITNNTLNMTGNYSQLLAGIEDLRAIVQPDFAKNIAVKRSESIIETIDNFGEQVAALVDVIHELESHGGIPDEMVPLVNYVKTQLVDAGIQAQEVVLELGDSVATMQISDGKKKDNQTARASGSPESSVAEMTVTWEGKQRDGRKDANDGSSDEEFQGSDKQKGWRKSQTHDHYDRLRENPKMRHHMEMHEAMMTGNFDFVHRTIEHFHRQHGRHQQETTEQRQRRLRRTARQDHCAKLVRCVEEFSLYDVVAWFYGPYVDDRGQIEDNVAVANAKGDRGIFEVVRNVQQKISKAKYKNRYRDSDCTALLEEFHTNENKDDFVKYHGGTVNRICRAKGTTKYIQIKEIRKKVGGAVADNLFDDLVKCSSNLGDSTFFKGGTPRIPKGVVQDRFGATRSYTVSGHYSFLEAGALVSAKMKRTRIPYNDYKRNDYKCVDRINKYYANIYKQHKTDIFKSGFKSLSYPKLQVFTSNMMKRVYIGIGNDSNKPVQICEFSSPHWSFCPHNAGMPAGAWTQFFKRCKLSAMRGYDVHGLFAGFDAGQRDTASTLALGDSMSIGSVCAYAEQAKKNKRNEPDVPGWCCADTPHDGKDWGSEYMCSQGKRACKKLAPVLAGLSQSACDPWSGKWCPYPRSCAKLMNCVKGELHWVYNQQRRGNKKKGYLGYLKAAPQVKNHMDQDQCGELREYFGFKPDHPLDDEICEDVRHLRTNRNFENLDQNFGSGAVSSGDDGKAPPKTELVEPKEPETTEAQFDAFDTALMAMEITIYGLQAAEKIAGYFECPSDPTNTADMICMGVKNALIIVSVNGVTALEKAMETVAEQIPTVSNHEQFQIYHNVEVLYKNMKIMNDGIGNIRTDIYNLKNSRYLEAHGNSIAKFAGCDGLDQDMDGLSDNCEEDLTPPEVVIPAGFQVGSTLSVTGASLGHSVLDEIFKSGEDAKTYLQQVLRVTDDCAPASSLSLNLTVTNTEGECETVVRAMPVHHCDNQVSYGVGEDFHMQVDSRAPTITCGFDSPQALVDDKKVLLLGEAQDSSRLVDTGFFLNVTDSCSDSVQVDVSVHSNEFFAGSGSLMAKAAVMEVEQVPYPKVFVDPSSCEMTNKASGCHCGSSVCVGASSKGRVYEIRVSATDKAGWTSLDKCHVVVVSEGDATSANNLRSLVDGERALALGTEASGPKYEIDRISLTWKTNDKASN